MNSVPHIGISPGKELLLQDRMNEFRVNINK